MPFCTDCGATLPTHKPGCHDGPMRDYITVEQKTIWCWQAARYFRDGWTMLPMQSGLLRYHLERTLYRLTTSHS